MTPRIGRVLGIFHHRVERKLMGRQPQRGQDGVWVYPPLLEDAGFQEVETYVSHHQNKVAHIIANTPIM